MNYFKQNHQKTIKIYMLENLKKRGLNKVLLFVTDGLKGIKEKLEEALPKAKYQTCWTHV